MIRPRPFLWGAAAAALALFATSFRGPALSPDSAVYLSVAESLAHGHGFVQFDGTPYVRWAPLYPLLLSLPVRLGLDIDQAARAFGAACFGLFVFLNALWLERRVHSRRWSSAGLLLVLAGTIVLECACFVWSEALFLVFVQACLLALDRVAAAEAEIDEGPARAPWMSAALAAGAWTALACLTRYAGLALVPLGMVVLWHGARRLGPALLYGLLSTVPLAAWLVRNALVTGRLVGEHNGPGFTPLEVIAQFAHGMSLWVAPAALPAPARAAVLLGWLVLGAIVVRASLARGPAANSHRLMLGFCVCYAALLLGWTMTTAVERIDERYLAPLFAPLACLLVGAVDRPARAGVPRWLAQAMVLVLLAFTLGRTALRVRGYESPGAWGYRNDAWRQSETLAWIARAQPAGPLYSNGPDAIYALVRVPARLSPRAHPYNAPHAVTRDLAAFTSEVARTPDARLVWFDVLARDFLISPDSLARVVPLALERRMRDGAVYRIDGRIDARTGGPASR